MRIFISGFSFWPVLINDCAIAASGRRLFGGRIKDARRLKDLECRLKVIDGVRFY